MKLDVIIQNEDDLISKRISFAYTELMCSIIERSICEQKLRQELYKYVLTLNNKNEPN